MNNRDVIDYFRATRRITEGFFSVPVEASHWRGRFNAIRRQYAEYQRLVSAGVCDWKFGDPYSIADWLMIFTPIERGAWSDIRELPFSVWPQYPVGKYFVDFAIVHKRIAIECDGAAYHDAKKDAIRDAELRRMGWHVVRIPGRDCWTDEGAEIIRSLA